MSSSRQIMLARNNYREPHQIRQLFETLHRAAACDAGCGVGGGLESLRQLTRSSTSTSRSRCRVIRPDSTGQAALRIVTPGLFKTLGIPLLQGRDLDDADGNSQVRRLVVDQAFVRKYLPDPYAIGKQVVVFLGAPQTYEIVGVVGEVHHYGMLQPPKPSFYISFASRPFAGMGVVVRTAGDPMAFVPAFRKQLWALDPALPLASAESMEGMVRDTWNDRTFLTILFVCFTVVVVALTTVGVFSVVTYSVSRQMREIAIHLAVGAQKGDVIRLVLGQSGTNRRRQASRWDSSGPGCSAVGSRAWSTGCLPAIRLCLRPEPRSWSSLPASVPTFRAGERRTSTPWSPFVWSEDCVIFPSRRNGICSQAIRGGVLSRFALSRQMARPVRQGEYLSR